MKEQQGELTLTPQAAMAGARMSLALLPVLPVLCREAIFWLHSLGQRISRPENIMARIKFSTSPSVNPRRWQAMRKEPVAKEIYYSEI